MPLLTGQQVLDSAEDTQSEEVPEWLAPGAELDPNDPPAVLVRGLDAAYISELMKKGALDDEGIPLKELDLIEIARRSMINPDGTRMFPNRKQVDKLGEKSFAPISRIATTAMMLAKLGKEDAGEPDDETADPKAEDSPT